MDVAELKLGELENRLLLVECSNKAALKSTQESVNDAVVAYQKDVLERLKEIRLAIKEEGKEGNFCSASGANVIAERDAALALVKKQQGDIEKLNYRIKHLVKALEAAENNNK